MVLQEWAEWITKIEWLNIDQGPVVSQDLFLFSCSVSDCTKNNKQLCDNVSGHDQYPTKFKMGFKLIDCQN